MTITTKEKAERAKKIHAGSKGRDEWLCGYAAALAGLNRIHDRPELVKDTISNDGLALVHFQAAGAEPYDLRELRKCMRP